MKTLKTFAVTAIFGATLLLTGCSPLKNCGGWCGWGANQNQDSADAAVMASAATPAATETR